jgi:hypothetical protein
MSDVLARLMRWMETSDIDDADVVLRDAITEIAGLRARLHERRRKPTLTDEEREAIANGASSLEAEVMREGLSNNATAYMRKHAATLRGLLARLS